MSLRWKMALAMAAVAVVCTLALGIGSYRSTVDRLLAEVDQSLLVLDQSAFQPGGDDLPERNPLSVYDAQIIRADGEIVQSTFAQPVPSAGLAAPVIGRPQTSVFHTISVDGVEYRVRTVGINDGAVQIMRSLEETNRVIRDVRNRTIALVLGIGAAAAVIGWLIAGRVTKPLRQLTEATEAIAATGDLEVRVDEGSDEVGRLGQGFNEMTDALAQSRAEQHRLVQDAGHELRTPLTSLRTNVDLLTRFGELSAEQRDSVLTDLGTELAELSTLVDEVLLIAQGNLDDEATSTIDLVDIADEVAERFSRRTDRPITVTADAPVLVVGQRDAIGRALSCLVDNACKFDATGGPIELLVSEAAVTVADRGPGVDDAEIDRIFERFYRSDSARSEPGSGLGLSIVRHVVQRNGGTVTVNNRNDGGAEFRVTLPEPLPPPS